MSRPADLDRAEHRALVAGLPDRLSVLIAVGAMAPAEAEQCLLHVRAVVAKHIDEAA